MNSQNKIYDYFGASSGAPSPQSTRKREWSPEWAGEAKKYTKMGEHSELLREIGKLIDEKNLASKDDVELIRADVKSLHSEIQVLKEENEAGKAQTAEVRREYQDMAVRLEELVRRSRNFSQRKGAVPI